MIRSFHPRNVQASATTMVVSPNQYHASSEKKRTSFFSAIKNIFKGRGRNIIAPTSPLHNPALNSKSSDINVGRRWHNSAPDVSGGDRLANTRPPSSEQHRLLEQLRLDGQPAVQKPLHEQIEDAKKAYTEAINAAVYGRKDPAVIKTAFKQLKQLESSVIDHYKNSGQGAPKFYGDLYFASVEVDNFRSNFNGATFSRSEAQLERQKGGTCVGHAIYSALKFHDPVEVKHNSRSAFANRILQFYGPNTESALQALTSHVLNAKFDTQAKPKSKDEMIALASKGFIACLKLDSRHSAHAVFVQGLHKDKNGEIQLVVADSHKDKFQLMKVDDLMQHIRGDIHLYSGRRI